MTDSGVVVTERLRAALLSEKRNNHTHQWTLYLRPFHQEDISKYIRKFSSSCMNLTKTMLESLTPTI
uniref:Uncharacterized protein n=1 Tax=Ditylenchus dipsaci TaxID=166011 RepID=A0A915D2P1_9BILA